MNYLGKVFLILGASKSGKSATELLLSKGAECLIYEEVSNYKIDEYINELLHLGAKRISKEITDEQLKKVDVCVISPGVPINHFLAVRLKELNKTIIGELELGYQLLLPNVVAVTGTNGKTTTVSLLNHVLSESGRKCYLVGNVGNPITKEVLNIEQNSSIICEVSSFQLESINKFHPKIACVLNISPDHLERHYTMDNYVYLKNRLMVNQTALDYCVLNYDDLTVRAFAENCKAKVIWVSLKEKVNGVYLSNEEIFFNQEKLLSQADISLVGEHNLYNCLFCVACAKILGLNSQEIINGISTFKGVKHRIQLVNEIENVKYYNDSKSTNTASTISALSTITQPTLLILGGSEKGENYDKLFTKIKESFVKHVILTGASRYNMLSSAGKVGVNNLTVTPDLKDAVKIAKMLSTGGDAVLLSPACASFDQFSGYEERGETFIKLVESFSNQTDC